MNSNVERWLGTLFGLIFMGLSVVVTVETLMRKIFNVSLQGADELGGYSLAIGSTIAFSLALYGRAHIRVDVFHDRLPARLQTFLNWLSIVSLAAFAVLMAWLAWYVFQDTKAYMSVSQTPWATPLIYPQSAWLFGLVVFALVGTGFAVHATVLLLKGRVPELNLKYGPSSTKQQVDAELEDLKARSSAPSTRSPVNTSAPSKAQP